MRITRCCTLKVWSQEDLLHTERPVTGRLAGCKEEFSGQAAAGGGDGRPGSCGVGSVRPKSGAWQSRSRNVLHLSSDGGWRTVSFALNAPCFILVEAARRRPLGGRSLLGCTFIG
jgi:hypothetical protein